MKRVFLMILLAMLSLSLVGCGGDEQPTGGGESEVVGSLIYFYTTSGEMEAVFSSSLPDENKSLRVEKGVAYEIRMRPSFRGSRAARYIGDVAEFDYPDGACEVVYTGGEETVPTYVLLIYSENDFLFTVTVGGYTQTVSVKVR